MATMKIKIKGIAVCYNKDAKWKVLFPFNDDHTVKISANGSVGTSLGFPNREIKITRIVNATSTFAAPTQRSGFCHFINITDPEYTHRELMPTADWPCHGVLMTVDNASFSAGEDDLSGSHYLMKENGSICRQPAIVGYTANLEVSAEQIFIDALDKHGNEVFKDPFVDDCEVLIDNTCPSNCPHTSANTDFDMIYSVLSDTDPNNRQRKFTLEREPRDAPNWLLRLIDWIRGISSLAILDNNNPKPGYKGLPCNVFRASSTAKLP